MKATVSFNTIEMNEELFVAIQQGLSETVFVRGSEAWMGDVGIDDIIPITGPDDQQLLVKVVAKKFINEKHCTELTIALYHE